MGRAQGDAFYVLAFTAHVPALHSCSWHASMYHTHATACVQREMRTMKVSSLVTTVLQQKNSKKTYNQFKSNDYTYQLPLKMVLLLVELLPFCRDEVVDSVQPEDVDQSQVQQYTNANPGLGNRESNDLKGEASYSIHEESSRLLEVAQGSQLEVRHCEALLILISNMKLEEHLKCNTHCPYSLFFHIVRYCITLIPQTQVTSIADIVIHVAQIIGTLFHILANTSTAHVRTQRPTFAKQTNTIRTYKLRTLADEYVLLS